MASCSGNSILRTVNEDQKGGRNYINTPVYRDGFLFAANGYGQTSAKIKIPFDGSEPTLSGRIRK